MISPLDYKDIQPVHPKGDQSWVFIGRTHAEAETPVLWPPYAKGWLIGKDSDSERDWGQEEKGTTEDEMAGWHHRLDAYEFEWTTGVGDGQGVLACCDSWGCKESDTTEWLNWLTDDPVAITLLFRVRVYTPFLCFLSGENFSICWRAGLVVLNSLSFCLSVKLLISPSYLNEILTVYSNCREQELRPWQKSWGRRLGIRKGGIKP